MFLNSLVRLYILSDACYVRLTFNHDVRVQGRGVEP